MHTYFTAIVTRQHSDSQDQFLRVVISVHAVQVFAKMSADFLSNLFHCQLLVSHPLTIKLQTKEPGGYPCGVKVQHLIVDGHKFLVICYHGVLWVRVIVDGCAGSHLPQGGVLNPA